MVNMAQWYLQLNIVDDYLELCEEKGNEPERPFKGPFDVRTGSDLHRRAVSYAQNKA